MYTLLLLNSKPPFLFNAAFSHNTKIRAELQVLGHTSLFKLFQNFLVILILFKLETGKSAEDTYEALELGPIRHTM